MSNISNSNLEEAIKYIKKKKEFQKIYYSDPTTKIFIALMVPILFGFIIYTFIPSLLIQIIVFSIISILSGIFFYIIGNNYSEKWAIISAFLVGTTYWIYVFIIQYRKQQENEKIGKKSFICNPTGVCNTDGIKGPYDGKTQYMYTTKTEQTNYIPNYLFSTNINDKFTYMFWIKIDYTDWINKNYYGRHKIILMKGNEIDTSDLVIYALPVNESIQFDIGNNSNKKVSISSNFSFDKWIHYTVVLNNKVIEVYKNATLEKSAIVNDNIQLKETPLYIGKTPDNSISDYFPGSLLYLSYVNSSLLPSEIYDIYQKEYSNISNFSQNIIPDKPDKPDCNPDKCTSINQSKVNQLFEKSSDTQVPLPSTYITLPSEYLTASGVKEKSV